MSVSIEERLLEVQRLVWHLQNAAELKDTALSHQLHDELGGLMGAAVMDLDSVRRVKPALSQNTIERVDRVKRTLEQAIDLNRRVIEGLRPSILDNFGLFAALRWQLKKTWGNSAVVSSQTYPDVEPVFESGAAIVLFRIAQEALSIALMREAVKSAEFTVQADAANFWMRFSDDGTSNAKKQSADPKMILASMRHRIRGIGGRIDISDNEAKDTAMTVWMPLRPSADVRTRIANERSKTDFCATGLDRRALSDHGKDARPGHESLSDNVRQQPPFRGGVFGGIETNPKSEIP